jgi:hypothetical protein
MRLLLLAFSKPIVVVQFREIYSEAKAKSKVVFLQKVAAQAQKQAKSLIPTKYETPETSGLTREVKQESNHINLDLTD